MTAGTISACGISSSFTSSADLRSRADGAVSLCRKDRRGNGSGLDVTPLGRLKLAEIQDSELPDIHALMSRYWDRPMDFADATLVYLAKRESLIDNLYRGSRGFRNLSHRRPPPVSGAAGRTPLSCRTIRRG